MPDARSPREVPDRISDRISDRIRSWSRSTFVVAAGFAILVGFVLGCSGGDGAAAAEGVRSLHPVVVKEYAHDTGAFTQGLLWHKGKLYEGTGSGPGNRGISSLRRVDLATGKVEKIVQLDKRYFGEGLALVGNRLIQLTWQNQIAFVYDVETFERVGQFQYRGPGWGLTYDGTHLIMSDGSEQLVFRDPKTFEEKRRIRVKREGRIIRKLNELEWVEGKILANIWQSNTIVEIDPKDGRVTATIDASKVGPSRTKTRRVLNGIAYDPATKKLWLTGKNWPKLYEVRLETKSATTAPGKK